MVILDHIFGGTTGVVCGTVTKYTEGSGEAKGKVVNIVIDNETNVAFWNSVSNKKMLADRIKSAHIHVGSFISAIVSFRDEGVSTAIAMNFKYSGIWNLFEKPPTATTTGIVADIQDNGNSIDITFDDDTLAKFVNFDKGYKFADRIRDVECGDEIAVCLDDSSVVKNFRKGDKWEITHSKSVVIGNVSFLDEGVTRSGNPYIRVNISIYKGKDDSGNPVFETAYVYFDNNRNKDMIASVRKFLKKKDSVAIVSCKNNIDTDDNVYTGFFFKKIKK